VGGKLEGIAAAAQSAALPDILLLCPSHSFA